MKSLRDSEVVAALPAQISQPSRRRRWAAHSFSTAAWLSSALVAVPVFAVLFRAIFGATSGASGSRGSTGIGADVSSQADNLAHLISTVLPGYAGNTLALAVGVLLLSLVFGIGTAWIVAAYQFPARRLVSVVVALPLAMPGFVLAYAYTDFFDVSGPFQTALRSLTAWSIGDYWFPSIRSLGGAIVVLSLGLYPYIYLFARASFASRSASLAEAARSLGYGSIRGWWKVVLPIAWPSIMAGAALVLMETLADFGAVSHFAVDTLAAGVYRSWQGLGDQVTAARLASILVLLALMLLWVENRSRHRHRYFTRSTRVADAKLMPVHTGVALAFLCLIPALAGFVAPMLMLCYSWWRELDASQSLMSVVIDSKLLPKLLNSALLGAMSAGITVPLAVLVAYAVRLKKTPMLDTLASMAASGYAFPGIILSIGVLVVAGWLSKSGIAGMTGFIFGGSLLLLLWAYVTRFFAVAYQGTHAALTRVSPNMDASARSLGESPWGVLRRIHWPLLRPSLAASFALVFVDTLKELPATLILRPFNMDTLAVAAYQYAADERLSAAALPSLLIVLLASIPTIWLARRDWAQERQ